MTSLRCQLGWLPTVKWCGLFVADHEGIFGRRGLDVTIVPGGPGLPGAGRAVAAGSAEIGIASDVVDVLRIMDGGGDLRVLAAVTLRTPLGLAVLGDRPPAMADLVGATLGAGTEDDRHVLDALFAVNGLEPDYRFRLTGRGLDELASGEVTAMCCSTLSQVPAARRRGLQVASATFGELGLPLLGDVVVASSALIERDRDAVAGFVAALAEGWAINIAEPWRGVAATMARPCPGLALDEQDCVVENDLNLAFMHQVGHGAPVLSLGMEDLAPSLDVLRSTGAIGSGLTASTCIDESIASRSRTAAGT